MVIESNFRFQSQENASPFSYSQITRWENLDQVLQGHLQKSVCPQASTNSEQWSSSPTWIPRMMLRHEGLMQPVDVRNVNSLGCMKARHNDIITLPVFSAMNGIYNSRAYFYNWNGNPFTCNCCWSLASACILTQSNVLGLISTQYLYKFHPNSKHSSNPWYT